MTLASPEAHDELVAAARRTAPVFAGAKLVAMRELLGRSQAELADSLGISQSALSQAERGETALSTANIAFAALVLEVEPEAFADRPAFDVALAPQFRHLKRTPRREQLRAERFVHATAQVARGLREEVVFPDPFEYAYHIDPDLEIESAAEQVEVAAARTREALGLTPDQPIGEGLVDDLESGGITIVRDPETDRDIDAYSAIVDDLPIIVLDGGEESVWDRDNFNLAHELGHLVMHRRSERRPGTRTVEAQANRFAGAFLGPAPALESELPSELDWARYLDLKRTWGLSMAALARRAKDIGRIDESAYTRAMKQRSAFGWRRVEPGSTDRALPTPTHLRRAADLAGLSPSDIARRVSLPCSVVSRILGTQRPTLV